MGRTLSLGRTRVGRTLSLYSPLHTLVLVVLAVILLLVGYSGSRHNTRPYTTTIVVVLAVTLRLLDAIY
jgi:hypothetical protein